VSWLCLPGRARSCSPSPSVAWQTKKVNLRCCAALPLRVVLVAWERCVVVGRHTYTHISRALDPATGPAVTHTGPCSTSPVDSGWVLTRSHFAAFSVIPFQWPGGHGWAHFVCKSVSVHTFVAVLAKHFFLLTSKQKSAMSSFHPYPLGLPGHAPTSHFVVAFAADYHGYDRTFSTSRSSGLCFQVDSEHCQLK
jgi:hypothetical protein